MKGAHAKTQRRQEGVAVGWLCGVERAVRGVGSGTVCGGVRVSGYGGVMVNDVPNVPVLRLFGREIVKVGHWVSQMSHYLDFGAKNRASGT